MKNLFRSFFLSFLLVVLFTSLTFPAGTISFSSPTEGQIITLIGSRSSVPVNILYGFTLDPNYLYQNYQKLFADPIGTYQSNTGIGIPQWRDLQAGTYQWRIELWQYDGVGRQVKTAEQIINFTVKYQLQVMNCFTGGNIIVSGNQLQSPVTVQKIIGDNISATAVEPQTSGGYTWVWNTSSLATSDWSNRKYLGDPQRLPGTYSKATNYTVQSDDNGAQLIANLKKQYTTNFQNNFQGVGNGGTIIVNGTQYTSPANGFPVVEQNPITATAQDQTVNGIDYTFTGWYDGPASNPNANLISSQKTPPPFYPGGNATYYAHFVGYPNTGLMNVQDNSTVVGAHPTLTWTDNANSNVSYQIYQSTRFEGQTDASPFTLLASVARNVQHYTAIQYTENSQKVNLLWLQLRPIYSVENTFRNAATVMFDIEGGTKVVDKRNFGNNQTAEITEYKLYNNFPNPFNPSTEINYQIPNDGNVKLKVYNMMGQEIMTLVNEFKEKGMYSATFNAGSLASGMYIYKLESGNYTQVKKMLLTK